MDFAKLKKEADALFAQYATKVVPHEQLKVPKKAVKPKKMFEEKRISKCAFTVSAARFFQSCETLKLQIGSDPNSRWYSVKVSDQQKNEYFAFYSKKRFSLRVMIPLKKKSDTEAIMTHVMQLFNVDSTSTFQVKEDDKNLKLRSTRNSNKNHSYPNI